MEKKAKKFNLFVIEDCAEGLGSYYKKKHVGIFGDAGTFSFYGNKTISTGEGGMVVFKSKKNSLILNFNLSKLTKITICKKLCKYLFKYLLPYNEVIQI